MPKPGRPPRQASQVQAMQARIATQALRLFRDEGFDSVSIRRLAKEVGCAPMTIYAHFDSKTDILQFLWAEVLRLVFDEIGLKLQQAQTLQDRLAVAAKTFVRYWLNNSDHFRLVFMSNGVSRTDVNTFMQNQSTLQYFQVFSNLVAALSCDPASLKRRADTLVSGMIGIALCLNTIADYKWSDPDAMTEALTVAATSGDANHR